MFEEFAIDVGVDVHNTMTECVRNALPIEFVAASLLKRCKRMELAIGQQSTMLREYCVCHCLCPNNDEVSCVECFVVQTNVT